MVINHQYKFIFIHVTKTGGATIKNYLRKNIGDERDINNKNFVSIPYVQSTFFEGKDKKLVNGFYFSLGHMCIDFIRENFPQEFNNYYKFGFIRNPYERFLSSFFFLGRNSLTGLNEEQILDRFNNHFIPRVSKNFHINPNRWVMPQHKFLCDINNNVIVDFLARTDHLVEDFTKIANKLSFANFDVKKIITSNVSPNKEKVKKNLLLTEENKEKIYNLYKKDFEIFHYSKEYKI